MKYYQQGEENNMPQGKARIAKNVEGCKGKYAVVSIDSGRILGCHQTRDEALNQLQAFYAQQSRDSKKK